MAYRKTLILILNGIISLYIGPVAVLAEQSCEEHGQAQVGDNGNPQQSSPCIHKHREGVLLPLGPTVSAMPLSSIDVKAEATFFSCMVRNFIINVRAEFVLGPPANDTSAGFAVAFPVTTHALYGDHNRFRKISVSVDNARIPYRVAMDYGVWSTAGGQLRYKGRLVNHEIHPLLVDAKDLNIVAPHLVAKGFDLVIYWHMPPTSSVSTRVAVEYTTNSNDFSSCCHEVRDCTGGPSPYHFYFDLSNAQYWRGPKRCHVVLCDSGSGEWSSVPTTNMETVCTRDAIELSNEAANANLPLPDLAVPVQPSVFDVWPRRWPVPASPVQEFTLSWLSGAGGMIDQAVIDQIAPTPDITVHAELPIVLNDHNPSENFAAASMPPIPKLAYIDAIGGGYCGQQPHGLYNVWLRIPLAGDCIAGHDLAVSDLKVVPSPGGSSEDWTVHVTVSNIGLFTEPMLVTILVDNIFVKSEGFRSLLPGDVVHLTIPLHWVWELPAEVEVEVEPAPGEVSRMNNAASVIYPPSPLPRHARFVLRPDQSRVRCRLDSGLMVESKLIGAIQLHLGDPDVPVIGIAGVVGLSVDSADLTAPHFKPVSSTGAALPEPLYMFQAPWVRSIGSWNTITGDIQFEMYLVTPDGEVPAQQPMICSGRLTNAGLSITGLSSEPTAIPRMMLDIYAYEVPLPPPPLDVWFSTEVGFHPSRLDLDAAGNLRYVSDGDLLSRRGHIVHTNRELTAHLGIMPVVPDLGLDAVTLGRRSEIWFSFEEEYPRIWSETLAVWLKHGDLLSDRGYVVATNEKLLARFGCMPAIEDMGLDAVVQGPNRTILFSTEQHFFSQTLGTWVGHGDLLSNRGQIVRTNAQLLENFHPIDPIPLDFGLDAVVLRPQNEIWFSTEVGFTDASLGAISDGDLLSTRGYIVARNLKLLAEFAPIEDLANFGLDAVTVIVPCLTADFDQDGDVGHDDFSQFKLGITGPAVMTDNPLAADFDGDNDVDQSDFGIFQRCLSGEDNPADPSCAD